LISVSSPFFSDDWFSGFSLIGVTPLGLLYGTDNLAPKVHRATKMSPQEQVGVPV
jgi:hypothetical protein